MILWDGEVVHDRAPDGCWADRDGRACGEPTTILGLCGICYATLTSERPAQKP